MKDYRDYIVRQESPDVFHFWVGMLMVGAAMRRNVYIDRGAYKVFPNQYVFLIGKSGMCKKSAALDIGIHILEQVDDIHIIHGRATVEGLIDAMNRVTVRPDGRVVPDGSLLIHADELSYLFGKASYVTDVMNFLTAAYTGRSKLDFLTRNKGLCKVRNPAPSILAAATPDTMSEIFPSTTIASGFMGRVVIVASSDFKRVAKPQLRRDLEEQLVHDLNHISQLCGRVQLTDEAEEYFEKWYEHMSIAPSKELDAFFQRKHDHALKAALHISMAESDDMVITKDQLLRGIMAIEQLEEGMSHTLADVGATSQGSLASLVEGIIRSKAPMPVSRTVLLRRVYKKLSYGAQEFQSIIDILKEAGRIKESATSRGIFYEIVS